MLTQRHPATLHARARQEGAVLVVALVVLLLVTLAGIALMRSVDTTTLVAGNLAFQQAATRAADAGVERAIATLQQLAADGQLDASDSTNSYFATLRSNDSPDPAVPARRDWPTLWANSIAPNIAAPAMDNLGNAVEFAIHRQCTNAAPANAGGDCVTAPGQPTSSGSSEDSNDIQIKGDPGRVYYRITVRVTGPRRTESYVQVHVAM